MKMEDQVAALVLRPFREIVDKGSAARENATGAADAPGMHRAAQKLVKEGERALKRIEPLCWKHLHEHGAVFIDALKDDDEMAAFRTSLDDALYEFDDYVEAAGFEAEKFDDLQALSRKAAPRIAEILYRMKLEQDSLGRERQRSCRARADGSAPPDCTCPMPDEAVRARRMRGGYGGGAETADADAVPGPVRSAAVMGAQAGPILDWEEQLGQFMELPSGTATVHANGRESDASSSPRFVARPGRINNNEPVLSPLEPERNPWGPEWGMFRLGDHVKNSSRRAVCRPRPSTAEEIPVSPLSQQAPSEPLSPATAYGELTRSPSPAFTELPSKEAGLDGSCDGRTGTRGPQLPWPRLSAPPSCPTMAVVEQAGLEPIPVEPDNGLIPLLPCKASSLFVRMKARIQDCRIGPHSSINQLNGLCPGAREIMAGEAGVKRVRKPGIGAGNTTVARCRHCMYELDWNSVAADINREDSANYVTKGVGFRLRFLSKSHVATKNAAEELYGCLFCVQLGRTMEESDATVFFSQKQLFAHLARHARPLPEVPGLRVVEAEQVMPMHKNNLDLHFGHPPTRSVMWGLDDEVSMLPTAVATETVRAGGHGLRGPGGRQLMLQFAVGARIVGVEFPARWMGEWAVGWADNARGVFPVANVRIEPPPREDIRRDATSGMRAMTRWRRHPSAKHPGPWLKFDRDEVITKIAYAHPGHWCWSGYNTKGKWGIFPQAFVEPNTLRETVAASIASNEMRNRLFRALSLRGPNARPSSAGAQSDS